MERIKAMKRLELSLVALLAGVPPAAFAQDVALDEIVVSANRAPTERNRSGASVTVLTEADRGAAQEVGIAQAFAGLAGVSVSQQGPFGSPASVRIRGADQRYIAVFIDGIRVSDPTSVQTQFDFGTLPAAGIDRIEVLRGSQSALWGGSAVAGVITLTSPRPTAEGLEQMAQAEIGAFGTTRLGYSLRQKAGGVETSLTLSHLKTEGFSAAAAGTEADGAEAARVAATLRYRVSDTLAVGAALFSQRTRAEYDGFDASFTLVDKDNSQDRVETGARLFAELDFGRTTHLVDITGFRVGRDYDQEGELSSFDGSRVTVGWQARSEISGALHLEYGADAMRERARYSNLATGINLVPGIADTTIAGAFVQALWAPTDALDLSAALRHDDHSSFGSFRTGRVVLAWRPTAATTLRLAAATGFRAPSIDELFGAYPDSQFAGNQALTPEDSESFEIGVEHRFAGGATLSATAFRLSIDNLIGYAPCPTNPDFSCQTGTVNSLQNVAGRSVRQGIEVTAEVPVGDRVTLGLAYAYTDARRPGGARIGLVPYHDLSAALEAEVTEALTAGLTIAHVAGRRDDFGVGPMPDYTVMSLAADYDLGEGRSAYLRIENLLDETYQTSNGYATSGRAVYVGLHASF